MEKFIILFLQFFSLLLCEETLIPDSSSLQENSTNIIELDFDVTNKVNETTTGLSDTTLNNSTLSAEPENLTSAVTENTITKATPTVHPTGLIKSQLTCNCDHVQDLCEIGCCCDQDCSSEVVEAFGKICQQAPSENLKDSLWHCSSGHKVNRFFCIEFDNLANRHRFPLSQSRTIPSSDDFRPKNKIYQWESETTNNGDAAISAFFLGDSMNIQIDKQPVQKWTFPRRLISRHCDGEETLGFMKDITTECIRNPIGSKSCISNQFLDPKPFFTFWILPPSENETDCNSEKHCIPVRLAPTYLYRHLNGTLQMFEVNETNVPAIFWNASSNLCQNAFLSVKYELQHEGKKGIMEAIASFTLATINASLPVLQTFQAVFLLKNETKVVAKPRDQGYKMKSLVVVGKLIRLNKEETIDISLEGLTTFGHLIDGQCTSLREQVQFGVNINTACRLKKVSLKTDSQHCEFLKNVTGAFLTGEEEFDLVGKFPNADSRNLGDWITKTQSTNLDKSSGCAVPTNLRIEIVYQLVGLISKPQIQILSFNAQIEELDIGEEDYIELQTLVSFFDATPQPEHVFGRPPSIDVHFPGDFFYPFRLSRSTKIVPRILLFMSLLMLVCF